MPIEYRIDSERRLVVARVLGTLTEQELFDYQRTVWSDSEIAGYNELVDMTGAKAIAKPTTAEIQMLAAISARMDSPAAATKFAIVAPEDLAFGLGRMYQAYRGMEEESTKEVRVFRSEAEALAYLGIEGPLPGWEAL